MNMEKAIATKVSKDGVYISIEGVCRLIEQLKKNGIKESFPQTMDELADAFKKIEKLSIAEHIRKHGISEDNVDLHTKYRAS